MPDRTEEFRGAVKVFRPTLANAATGGSNGIGQGHHIPTHSLLDPPPPPRPEASEFFQVASSVAVGFEGTSKLVSTSYLSALWGICALCAPRPA